MSLTEYIQTRWDLLSQAAMNHVLVVALSVGIATVIGVGVGVLTYNRPRLSGIAIGASSGFLTIPSFALLGLFIPILGLGWTSTVVALVGYSMLPIVRNTVVGLRGVDAAMVEAGRGIGMSAAGVMLRIQLPLAWPVILTGIRVSTQMIIGIAAIAAYVAGPGLGNQIFDGLARLGSVNALNAALAGTLGVVVLALLFDLFYLVIRHLTTSRGLRV
ncbi:ABC transporter permease [Planosporangium thailandense]|uniref:ABC transporter permease n=1 Tax=Planosporangium thailandense TaxID=765197 RepID=A0ABX0Y8S3_9ACTN|nr:ABC transporter permease [Planosporangium thailandense]NJC73659.1 ABC transporter permease [Planosporangium thailandense]